MNHRQRGLMLLAIQVALALSVAGKLAWDRATLPRAWARSVPVDPDDPLRGRYVRLWLDAADRRSDADSDDVTGVEFGVQDSQLVVRSAEHWEGLPLLSPTPRGARGVVVAQSVAFYLPEHAADPSRLAPGQELWVEVTVVPRGLPRPIRVEPRPTNSTR
jgi:hypothetical protein